MTKRPTSKTTRKSNDRRRRTIRPEDQDDDTPKYQPAAKIRTLEITPRNRAQQEYLDVLNDETHSIVFAMGPAGTGKTLLATQFGIKGLLEGRFKKIVLTRPAVSVDEQHGFLPGDLNAKMEPWVAPIMDVFKEVFPIPVLTKMIRDEVISVVPLAFSRGRTFKHSLVICDEMQNSTPSQMKMMLTRIGDESRMIVTGDLKQHDRGFSENGFRDFIERLSLQPTEAIAVCRFGSCDIERHPVIDHVLRIYGDS